MRKNVVHLKENLQTVWRLHAGKFDDGIPEVLPKGDKLGPHFRELMDLFGVKEENLYKDFCEECGAEHYNQTRRCPDCLRGRKRG